MENYFLQPKLCSKCGETKPLIDFGIAKRKQCKKCYNQARKEYNRRTGSVEKYKSTFGAWTK